MMTYNQFLLTKLMEECAEVGQRAAKQQQFGKDESQPGHTETNADRLRDEINDLKAIVVLLEEAGEVKDTSPEEFEYHLNKKSEKLVKYYVYSQKLGFVE